MVTTGARIPFTSENVVMGQGYARLDRVRDAIVAGEPVGHEEMNKVLPLIPRRDRFDTIASLADALPAVDLNLLLVEWWTDTEFPSLYGTGRIVALFRRAGFVSDRGEAPPTGPLIIYRGVGEGVPTPRGVSWTLSEERAAWFARRFTFATGDTVYAAEIMPEGVLGILHERDEAEVLVDPRRLRRLRVLRSGVRQGKEEG